MRFFVSMFEANGSNPSFEPTATGKRASAAQLNVSSRVTPQLIRDGGRTESANTSDHTGVIL